MINQELLSKIREYVELLNELEENGGANAVFKEVFQAEIDGNTEEITSSKKSLFSVALKAKEAKAEVRKIAENDIDFIVLYHQLVLAEDEGDFLKCAEIKNEILNYEKKS